MDISNDKITSFLLETALRQMNISDFFLYPNQGAFPMYKTF